MRTMTPKIKEHTCQTCKGTGFPVVAQPISPDRKIYPVKCKDCDGKGKTRTPTEAAFKSPAFVSSSPVQPGPRGP